MEIEDRRYSFGNLFSSSGIALAILGLEAQAPLQTVRNQMTIDNLRVYLSFLIEYIFHFL